MKSRLQSLNPRATIDCVPFQSIQSLSQYPYIIACNPTLSQLNRLFSLRSSNAILCVWSTDLWGMILNLSYFPSFTPCVGVMHRVDALLKCTSSSESALCSLQNALQNASIPTPSPITLQAIIGGLLSQVLVSIVTGEKQLQCALEFDAQSLNGTEREYVLP